MTTPNPRLGIDGTAIANTIQHDHCAECGMGLCDPREWHPYEACLRYTETHSSLAVWAFLHNCVGKPWEKGERAE